MENNPQEIRRSMLGGNSPRRPDLTLIIPVQNRDSLVVRQNLATQVEYNVYNSINYLITSIITSVVKVLISIAVLVFTDTQCTQPLADFIFYIAIHDALYTGVLLLKLLAIVQNPEAIVSREAYYESLENGDEFGGNVQDIRELETKMKAIRSISFILSLYYTMVFVYGQILYFQESDCAQVAPVLSMVSLVYIVLGYIYIGIPILFGLLACLCLPFILVGAHLFSKRQQKGLNEEILKKLPVIKYNSTLPGSNECSICMIEYHEGDSLLQLKCSPMHYFHEDCLKKWLRINQHCPICRAPVEEKRPQADPGVVELNVIH